MLFSVTGDRINNVPHKSTWNIITQRLTQQQLDEINAELDNHFDAKEINTSSWLPGNDWTDTVYEPIYSIAARQDQTLSAKMFGLIVWMYVSMRPDAWMQGRYEKDEVPISGLTYFRVPGLDN